MNKKKFFFIVQQEEKSVMNINAYLFLCHTLNIHGMMLVTCQYMTLKSSKCRVLFLEIHFTKNLL